MTPKQIYAEDLNFWRSGEKRSNDSWMELTAKQIEQLGGKVFATAFGDDGGHAAYIIGFQLGGDRFKVVWPLVKSKCGDGASERRQAVTTLYHVVKAKCLEVAVRGPRVAFAGDWLLPNGRTVGEMTSEELSHALPLMLSAPTDNESVSHVR